MSWSDAGRVLAVRLDALGDVLMTTPALRALKDARPGRHLTLLTSPAGAAAAALVPEVDDVLAYEAPWMKATPPRTDSVADRTMIERVRAGRFDGAVVFTVYSQNPLPAAMLCYLAGVPRRLAHRSISKVDGPRGSTRTPRSAAAARRSASTKACRSMMRPGSVATAGAHRSGRFQSTSASRILRTTLPTSRRSASGKILIQSRKK